MNLLYPEAVITFSRQCTMVLSSSVRALGSQSGEYVATYSGRLAWQGFL